MSADPRRWTRRLVTLSGLALAWVSLPVLLPLALLLGAAVDTLRRSRLARVRTALMVAALVVAEGVGVLAAAGVWVRWRWDQDAEAWLRRNYALQRRWNLLLSQALTGLFALRWEVQGAEALDRGPLLVLIRHVSTADTVLPVVLLSVERGFNLRYVLKHELSLDPCLDIVGRRLPNAFVRRGEGGAEVDKVAALADNLGPRDAVVLFPEGTRFSEEARARRLAELAGGDPELLALARGLRHTLPPKTAGALALLRRAPQADVVFCAHTGFEGTRRLDDLLAGRLIGQTIRVRFSRVPAAEIPQGELATRRWLMARWGQLDAQVGEGR